MLIWVWIKAGMVMLIKDQLFTFCAKDYRTAKGTHAAAYKQFLAYYFQHFIEDEHDIADMGYFSQAAMSQFTQLLNHKKHASVINITSVNIQKQYLQTYTRIQLAFKDTPFMVESIRGLFSRLGFQIKQSNLMANFHVSKEGSRLHIEPAETDGDTFAWFDIEMHTEMNNTELRDAISAVMGDVECVVRDWRRMQDTLRNIMYSWRDTPSAVASADLVQSYVAFMEWVLSSFAFLSYHGYKVKGKNYTLLGERWGLSSQKGAKHYLACQVSNHDFPHQVYAENKPLIYITQTADLSTVHRNVHKDMIALRVYRPGNGAVLIEEHYFTGLLTADAYVSDPSKIPLISQKFDEAMNAHGLRSRYSLRRMGYILKSLPREEIFQSDIQTLAKVAYDIFMIQERPVVKSFIRRDICKQFYSVMVYIPRQMLTTRLRIRLETFLMDALNAQEVSYTPFFAESVLTRLHFVLRCDPDSEPKLDDNAIGEKLLGMCESWDDQLYTLLCNQLGQRAGYKLAKKYSHALSESYGTTYSAKIVAQDVIALNQLCDERPMDIRFEVIDPVGQISCRIFQRASNQNILLAQAFPVLTNLGLTLTSERHFEEVVNSEEYLISEYRCQLDESFISQFQQRVGELQTTVIDILSDKLVNDQYGALMISAGLNAREVEVIRALSAYLNQIAFPLSQSRVMKFFHEYPKFASHIIKTFNVKFQPKMVKREALLKRYFKEASKFSEEVRTSDDERVVQAFINLVDCVVRTNYCLPNTEALVLKIQSSRVVSIPKPAPMFEFFVFCNRVMGVHLRFSRTARGGIRNSDRLDDVRHEVFELAKTQRLKNTLIVPDGAKGGFVCRRLQLLDCESQPDEIKACYEIFIRSMLSVTDNIVKNKVCHHASLVVYDEQDPYFVVAADKGTATFSPYANAIAIEKHYWLGDAFASGGEYGYDHKKMGITAKGAWESVKWHFMSMKRDVYQEPFSVAGIGDMSGDVFGNGMLLSDQTRLVAAFGYARIFIDPNPDPKVSYQERMRLFHLPKSNWGDYNTSLISPGGGVFLRSDKYIELTPQMKKMFGTSRARMEPNEVIREILKLQVDLLWNGGIGVYVKSSKESHFDVMDFHNDECRIDAKDMKALVVGEGGNNGFTQLGRVEFAQAGGRINTDFIDNSAGVNTSDVEVNYKILFQALIAKKQISFSQRNSLLTRMTHKVSEHVLRNNFLQNVLIDLAIIDCKEHADQYIRMVDSLEAGKLLNRDIEKIPSKRELQNRKKSQQVFTRPEMAVLLSYCKIDLAEGIKLLDISKQAMTEEYLHEYFPDTLTKKYSQAINGHLLKNELIITELTNTMLSEAGMLFVAKLSDECNCTLAEVLNAYLVIRNVLRLEEIYQSLYKNTAKMHQDTFLYLLGSIQRSIYKSCRWLIRYEDMSKPDKLVKLFSNVRQSEGMLEFLPKKYVHRMLKIELELKSAQVKPADRSRICESRYFYQLFGLHKVATITGVDSTHVKQVYYQLANLLKFHKLKEKLQGLMVTSRWETIQKSAIDDDLGAMLERLTQVILLHAQVRKSSYASAVEVWTKDHQEVYVEIRQSLNEITDLRKMDLSVFVVVLARINTLLDGF